MAFRKTTRDRTLRSFRQASRKARKLGRVPVAYDAGGGVTRYLLVAPETPPVMITQMVYEARHGRKMNAMELASLALAAKGRV